MGYAELIEAIQSLPQDKRAEVFDFVEFLAAKSGAESGRQRQPEEWTDSEFAELAMRQALRGMEDEAVHYTIKDIKERWQ